MALRILCVGDVVGVPGRRALDNGLAEVRRQHQVDCNIVNVENTASGSGLTPALYKKLLQSGAQLMTLGDHVYRRKEIIPILQQSEQIVRPANLPPDAPGREYAVYRTEKGFKVAVVSVLGRLYMRMAADCPFRAVNRVLGMLPRDLHAIVVEIHAEATSEKIAMGWHADGRASIVFGTHTHVPTADERILPGGTAYVTDLGMTGPYDSVLGRDKHRVLGTLLSSVPTPFDVAERDARMCGVVVEVDPETRRARSIQRVRVDLGE